MGHTRDARDVMFHERLPLLLAEVDHRKIRREPVMLRLKTVAFVRSGQARAKILVPGRHVDLGSHVKRRRDLADAIGSLPKHHVTGTNRVETEDDGQLSLVGHLVPWNYQHRMCPQRHETRQVVRTSNPFKSMPVFSSAPTSDIPLARVKSSERGVTRRGAPPSRNGGGGLT